MCVIKDKGIYRKVSKELIFCEMLGSMLPSHRYTWKYTRYIHIFIRFIRILLLLHHEKDHSQSLDKRATEARNLLLCGYGCGRMDTLSVACDLTNK